MLTSSIRVLEMQRWIEVFETIKACGISCYDPTTIPPITDIIHLAEFMLEECSGARLKAKKGLPSSTAISDFGKNATRTGVIGICEKLVTLAVDMQNILPCVTALSPTITASLQY